MTDSTIEIRKCDIATIDAECIVNAANTGLQGGSGVCGAIFAAAGADELQAACDSYRGCPEGKAVITQGFKLKAKYIIHAVGPIYVDGNHGEEQRLTSAYRNAMRLVRENDCHTIAFPLLSSGRFGYPKEEAWRVAITAVKGYQERHSDYRLDVVFAVTSDESAEMGRKALEECASID